MTEATLQTRPFSFRRDFMAEAAYEQDCREKGLKSSYSLEEYQKAEKAAYEKGSREAKAALEARQRQELIDAERGLALMISELISNLDQTRKLLIDETVDFAVDVARFLSGAALDLTPDAPLKKAFHELLTTLRDEALIDVSCAVNNEEELSQNLEALLKPLGFSGRLSIRKAADKAPGEAVITWGKSGVDISFDHINASLEPIITDLKNNLAAPGGLLSKTEGLSYPSDNLMAAQDGTEKDGDHD